MNRKVFTCIVILIMLSIFVTPAAAKPLADVWQPGQVITLNQKIPINIVFIGYDKASIDKNALIKSLPATYKPVIRTPLYYGITGRDMGLNFNFQYHVYNTDAKFNTLFFKYLTSIGKPAPKTLFQTWYNEEAKNVLEVTDPVLYIDAPSVEKWLTSQAHLWLPFDPTHGYTIYYINWFGQANFKFHTYTKTDEPDPDTGVNFGEALCYSRTMIAWGGSYGRDWFYDLSAGPEFWTDNWNVDNPDLDGNGVEDYRLPPIWEYTAGGYRDPSALTKDLGLVTRYVAIDLLFTPSPLYDPMVTAPGVGGHKIVNITMQEDDPTSNGVDWLNIGLVYQKLKAFEPYYSWEVNLKDINPIDPGAQRAFRIWAGLLNEDDCWNPYGTPFAELFCYYNNNLAAYVPAYRPNDYIGKIFAFNTTADNMGSYFWMGGLADDNWVDGTQALTYLWGSPYYRDIGYGLTNTTIHEFGHHIGLSHPHDGYDSETGLDYNPNDAFYFVYSGDESNTLMTDMNSTIDFGRFNQDSMYRYETAGYLNLSNQIYAQILANPNHGKMQPLVRKATDNAGNSIGQFDSWNYLQAVTLARASYEEMAQAAANLGIAAIEPVQASSASLMALPARTVPHKGDPIRFPVPVVPADK